MNKKQAAIIALMMIVLLGCESRTTGKRVAIPGTNGPTGFTVAQIENEDAPESAAETATGKTAAEMLKELKETPQTDKKSGTFYPPIVTNGTGKDALAEKTDALLRQSGYVPNVDADKRTGAIYHTSDGDLKNLPDKYDDNSGN